MKFKVPIMMFRVPIMDSTTATVAAASSEPASAPVQDSPFQNYVCNLSPIESINGALVNSPLVFPSAHFDINLPSSLLRRTHSQPANTRALISESLSMSALFDTDKFLTELCDIDAMDKVAGRDIRQILSIEQNVEENLAPEVSRPAETEGKQSSPVFKKRRHEDKCAQDMHTIHRNERDYTPQSLHEQFYSSSGSHLWTISTSNAVELSAHDAVSYETRKLDSDQKKTSTENSGEESKHCNCKKSKCLKLYCQCFAAGIYCAESCACEGCFNIPNHKDTISEICRRIESRNPNAFTSKIIQGQKELLNNVEDGSQLTPSLARHKKGCSCKRSLCRKRYCECYQANVGCSLECRCKGCENIYGNKKDHSVTQEMISESADTERRLEASLSQNENKETAAVGKDISQSESDGQHNIAPRTPSFQYSDHGRDFTSSSYNAQSNLLDTLHGHYMTPEIMKQVMDYDYYRWDCENDRIMDKETMQSQPYSGSSSLCPLPRSGEIFKTLLQASSSGVLKNIVEADIPEISKKASTPTRFGKENELGLSSSENCRFIVKSMPPFPPLTTCTESKSCNDANESDIRDSDGRNNSDPAASHR